MPRTVNEIIIPARLQERVTNETQSDEKNSGRKVDSPIWTRRISHGALLSTSKPPGEPNQGGTGDGWQQKHPKRRAVHLGAHREYNRAGHLAESGHSWPERCNRHEGHPDSEQRVEEVAELQHT